MVANDYYAILGVQSTATEDEIRKAFRKKALQFHPDKNSSSSAEEIFKQINKAYEILSDADKRRTYDLQQQPTTTKSSSSSQQFKHEPSFQSHFPSTNNSHSSRFRFHDPFFNFHQRHAYFASKFHSPDFSFFDSTFGSSDDDETDYDPIPSSPFPSSHRRFRRKPHSKWPNHHHWPFDHDPFTMFDMLTRSVFDQFLSDDSFWHHSTARLRSASQQQHRTTSNNRTKIPVNHVTPSSKSRNDMKRTTSSTRFHSKDSDEENVEDQFVYQQSKPASATHQSRFRRRATDNPHFPTKPKLETCQYCFYPLTSMENLLKHESTCRHRPDHEQTYTTKCSFCHQNIRLSDYLDHEELCKQFVMKRQASEKKYSYTPTSKSHLSDNPKSSSGGLANDIEQLRTCNRCHRIFPVLSDLFNHLCDDENDFLSSDSKKNNFSLIDQISSTSPKSFKLTRQTSLNQSPIDKFITPEQFEHIPRLKRPLFHLNEQQHSSTAYINLRNPTSSSSSSSPIRVNS